MDFNIHNNKQRLYQYQHGTSDMHSIFNLSSGFRL